MVKLVFRREQYELAYASLLFQLYTRAKIGVNLNKNTKPICIGRKTSHLVDFLGKLCSLKHQPIPHPIKTLEICCFFVSFIIDCFYHSFLFHKSKLVTIIPVIILEAAILFWWLRCGNNFELYKRLNRYAAASLLVMNHLFLYIYGPFKTYIIHWVRACAM